MAASPPCSTTVGQRQKRARRIGAPIKLDYLFDLQTVLLYSLRLDSILESIYFP